MRMSSKDREFFSKEMLGLAEHFNNKVAPRLAESREHPHSAPTKVMMKNIQINGRKMRRLVDAFKAKGYTDSQWNKLLETSGAVKKMGQFGSALKIVPAEFFLCKPNSFG